MEREKQIQESTKKRIDFLPNVSFGHSFWPFPTRLTARDSLSDTNTTHKTTQAYYARLRLKDQIFVFNQMLEREYHSSRNGDGANDASPSRRATVSPPLPAVAHALVTPVGATSGVNGQHDHHPPTTHPPSVPGGVFENTFHPTPGGAEAFHGHGALGLGVGVFGDTHQHGSGFFPRNFSLSDLSNDLHQTLSREDFAHHFAIAENEEEKIGMKRNFSELSDL